MVYASASVYTYVLYGMDVIPIYQSCFKNFVQTPWQENSSTNCILWWYQIDKCSSHLCSSLGCVWNAYKYQMYIFLGVVFDKPLSFGDQELVKFLLFQNGFLAL